MMETAASIPVGALVLALTGDWLDCVAEASLAEAARLHGFTPPALPAGSVCLAALAPDGVLAVWVMEPDAVVAGYTMPPTVDGPAGPRYRFWGVN